MTIGKKIMHTITLKPEEIDALNKAMTFFLLVEKELFENCDEIASSKGDTVDYEDLQIALNVLRVFYDNGIYSSWEEN